MRAIKIGKLVSNLVTCLLFIIMIFLLYTVISSRGTGGEAEIFGYQLKTVLSGSMEPDIKTGSIVAIKPINDFDKALNMKKGDVITFISKDKDNALVTHRIIEVQGNGSNVNYITKGDNNDGPDIEPVRAANIVGQYNGFTIPFVGYLLNFGKSKLGSALMLVLPGLLILGYSFFTLWKAITEVEKSKRSVETTNG
jgi:signal peptidase I